MAARRAAAPRAPPGGLTAAPIAPALKHSALLAGAAAVLYGVSHALRVAPCMAAFALVALVAWPIWRYQREFALFERRAILAGVLRQESAVRRFFWSGHLAVTMQGIAALAWAALLLALVASIGPWQWAVLVADALFVALAAPAVARRLAKDVREEQVGLAARRWPLRWANLAVLAIAFFCVDYFVAGAPDTRGLGWSEVADGAFATASASVACPAIAAALGAVAAVDALAWHAAQVIIPTLADQGMRFVAWAVFLLQAGIVAMATTRVYLGLLAEADRRAADAGSLRAFAAAVVIAVLLIAAAAWLLRGVDRAAIANASARLVDAANPCRADTAAVTALRARLDGELAKVRADEHARTGQEIDAALAPLFAQAEKGVDAYLDWYFSIFGEYQRLVTRELPELMDRKLKENLFGAGFDARVEAASQAIADASAARVATSAAALGGVIATGAQSHPCLPERLDLQALPAIERDAMRVTAAVAGGAAVALAVRAAGRAAAAGAAARAASKPVYRGAASLGGRVVAKRAGAAATASVPAMACGPAAPICALVLGGIAWIAFDKALVEIDEALFRPKMRQEILDALEEQRRELAAQLRAVHDAAIDRSVDAANRSLDRVFIPARS